MEIGRWTQTQLLSGGKDKGNKRQAFILTKLKYKTKDHKGKCVRGQNQSSKRKQGKVATKTAKYKSKFKVQIKHGKKSKIQNIPNRRTWTRALMQTHDRNNDRTWTTRRTQAKYTDTKDMTRHR